MPVHTLYMLIGDEGSTRNNNELLYFIKSSLPMLQQMMITVKVETITVNDLANNVLQKALSSKGINKLPALVTPFNVFFGKNDIIQIYSTKMGEFNAIKQQQAAKNKTPDEQLSSYYMDAMNDKDDDNAAIGDGDQLLKDLSKNMGKSNTDKKRVESKLAPPREQLSQSGPSQSSRAGPSQSSREGPSQSSREQPVMKERADNIVPPSDELEIAKKVAKEYKQSGDDYNESDDLMLSAYWSRMALTDDGEGSSMAE